MREHPVCFLFFVKHRVGTKKNFRWEQKFFFKVKLSEKFNPWVCWFSREYGFNLPFYNLTFFKLLSENIKKLTDNETWFLDFGLKRF